MTSWQGQRGTRHERGYGSAWTKLRLTILARDSYLCQACLTLGRPTPATDVDHVRAKAKGGTDERDNLQSLCAPCHAAKTAEDNRRGGATGADGWPTGETRHGYSIPDGVRLSGIPVTLVCGPPASGKSWYVSHHAVDGDTIIDFDQCRIMAGGTLRDTRLHIRRQAFALRDQMIHELHNKTRGRCYLIVTAPTPTERKAWVKALGNVTVETIRTSEAECIARIKADPERAESAASLIGAVRTWWVVN